MSAPIQSLAEWLNTATADLSTVAKERIKLEIESHFQEAAQAYRADGQNEEQAQSAALKDLGDAKVWAKRFRKTHLTEDEATRLAKTWALNRKWFGKPKMLVLIYLLYILILAVNYPMWREYHASPLIAAISTGIFLGSPMLAFLVVRRYPRPSLGLLVTFEILSMSWFLIYFAYYGTWGTWQVLICMLPAVFMEMRRTVPLWLKLRKIEDFWREMPPPDATAS
jgi:hypothetical protein